jgi:hypothetical protein
MAAKIKIFRIMALCSLVMSTSASIFREDGAVCSSKTLVPTYQTAGLHNPDHNVKVFRINFMEAAQRKK